MHCLQTLPRVPWGTPSPGLGTTALDAALGVWVGGDSVGDLAGPLTLLCSPLTILNFIFERNRELK